MKRALAVGAAGGAAVVVAAFGATRPDPLAQAAADGCIADLAAMARQEVPHWVYVNDKDFPASGAPPPAQRVVGVVAPGGPPSYYGIHPSAVDDPTVHDAYDVNLNVRPDPPFAFLLGNANLKEEGEARERLHSELEQTAFPLPLWPEQGDRVELRGSWVWDCPHSSGAGQSTELHPFRVLWVQRAAPSPRSPFGESEGDLLITTDGTPAGKSADCAHLAKGDRAAFQGCFASRSSWQDANASYVFILAVPPRPSRTARLAVRVVDAGSTAGAPRVSATSARGTVRVAVTVTEPPGKRVVVAKQVFVGWRPVPVRALPQHLRLRFERLAVRRAMDPGCPQGQPSCASIETQRRGQVSSPPGEWLVYTDVAGIWQSWPLLLVRDGQVVQLSRTVDFYEPSRRAYRVLVFTRECDFGTISTSPPAAPPAPCPAGTGELSDIGGDDAPGTAVAVHRGAAGLVSLDGETAASSCPPANASGCYRVTYRVSRVRDERKRAAAMR